MNWTEKEIQMVWEKGSTDGIPIDRITKERWDECGALIKRDQHGKESDTGWEIDHVYPKELKGDKTPINLQPLHWKNNRAKSDNWPRYTSAVTYDNGKNVPHKQERVTGDLESNVMLEKRYTF